MDKSNQEVYAAIARELLEMANTWAVDRSYRGSPVDDLRGFVIGPLRGILLPQPPVGVELEP